MVNQVQVSKMSFDEIFGQNVQYEIPFFQRGYAWEKTNWQQLLDDINDNILEEFDTQNNLDDVEFFFGSIVIAEGKQSSHPNTPRRFLIIDGQQRLTTVYIALATIFNLLQKVAGQDSSGLSTEIGDLH